MPLFRRTRTTPTPPADPTLVIDPDYGDPDAALLRAAMTAGDWPTARRILSAEHDHDDFAFLVAKASRIAGTEQWLPDAVRADLDDLLPLLLYGARAIDWAWEARTDARAKDVSRDQFQVFHDRLRLAEDCLQDVVSRDPANTAAWTELITVARGLEMGQDEARRRFDQVIRHHPTHYSAHSTLLQQLCRKWGGSHETMHAFAREAVAAAPPGSRLGVLVPDAHLEHWLDLGPDGTTYFKSPDVLGELQDAARRSVLHPDYRPGKGWPVDNNYFAMAFSLALDYKSAAQQFHTIGDRVTEFPWDYHNGGAIHAFTLRRARALAATNSR